MDVDARAIAADAFKSTPLVVVLLVVLWAGVRGHWVFGRNARRVVADVERQRDEWKALALALLRQRGIDVSDDGPPPRDPSDLK